MRDFSADHSAIALNTATLGHMMDGRGAGWSPEQVVDACAERGFGGIVFWRREIKTRGHVIGARVRAAGMKVQGLCRAPFLVGALAPPTREKVMDDFHASIDMAAELGAKSVTVVAGGVIPGTVGLSESLKRVEALVGEVAPYAAERAVMLALEPLHPVYGGDRSCLVTVRDAIDICKSINEPNVGVAVDVYHVWWDTSLGSELKRAGKNMILGYHVCDWLAETRDVLLDRGMMGDGVADLKGIRGAVEDAGYDGLCEVEVFSAANWWMREPGEVLDVCVERFRRHC